MANKIIIDVYTEDANVIKRGIQKLASTVTVEVAPYVSAPECSQIVVVTSKTVEQVEEWLMKSKSVPEFIGVIAA